MTVGFGEPQAVHAGRLPVAEICAAMGSGRTTLHRCLTPEGEIRKESRP